MDKLGFTFYPKDWWTSESYFELTPIQRYYYLECLFIMYSNDGYMKTQKTQFENRTRCMVLDSDWDIITQKFVLENNLFTHVSVNKRMRKAIANRENGKKGGRPPKEVEKPKKPKTETQKNPPLESEREIESKKNSLEARTQIFKDECKTFIPAYGTELVKSFFLYWSEPNPSNTKMKYELQKTWELSRRLSTWSKNETNFKKPDVKPKSNLGI